MYRYPDQRSQEPHTCDIPSQMRVNPLRHMPASYEPWPYGGGSYGYRIPDSYNYFPPYYCSGYPHTYHPPLPLPYFHGACIPSMHHHPVYYAPPPNYSMELPIYDYDKKSPLWQCAYHHQCRGEKEPEAEKRNDSIPPAQVKNLPYTIAWVPSEGLNIEKKMQSGFTEPEFNTMNNHGNAKKLEKGEKNEVQPRMDGSEFQFPIIYIPYKPKEEGKKDHDAPSENLPQTTTNDLINHCKIVPVKQMNEMVENAKEEDDTHTISKEHNSEFVESKRQEPSPLKTCKLPPVCLRVEPFPRRKSGSMKPKLRSLSPPKKGKPQDVVISSPPTMGLKDVKLAMENATTPGKDSKDDQTRRRLTESEAAILIQAAHRGHEVRKWEPVKKLKEIGKVREELEQVKSQVKAMKSSSSSSDKEITSLGEIIMKLLLKLDTIQGLDPFVWEMRKSIAKELVSLQEEVDSLLTEQMKNSDEESGLIPLMVDTPTIESEKEMDYLHQLEETETEQMKNNDEGSGLITLMVETPSLTESEEAKKEGEFALMGMKVDNGGATDEMKNDDEDSGLITLMVETPLTESEEAKKEEEFALMGMKVDNGGVTDQRKKDDEESGLITLMVETPLPAVEEANKEGDFASMSEAVAAGSGDDMKMNEEEEEEDKTVKETMEKLLEKGKEQMEVITVLTERVKMLEKKLAKAAKKGRVETRARTKTRTGR